GRFPMRRSTEANMRVASALCLALALSAPIASEGADRKEGSRPWIDTAGIIRDGGPSGSRIYLNSGLVHHRSPLDCLRCEHERTHRQRDFTREDFEAGLARRRGPQSVVGRSGEDPVIVVDAWHATRSYMVSPQVQPFT